LKDPQQKILNMKKITSKTEGLSRVLQVMLGIVLSVIQGPSGNAGIAPFAR
jgi:hypothetical protein